VRKRVGEKKTNIGEEKEAGDYTPNRRGGDQLREREATHLEGRQHRIGEEIRHQSRGLRK